MTLIKIGDRGAQVTQLQQNLNALPSRLPRLKVDGVFGPGTQARVIEFQRDNGLKADGIVGELTSAKLRAGGALQSISDLEALIKELALQLNPIQRASFAGSAHQLIAAPPPVLANTLVIEALIVLIIILFFATLMIQSNNKATQEQGRALSRQVNNLRERLRANPAEAEAVTAEALQNAKEQGRRLAKRAQEERDKCFQKFTPDQFASKSRACAKFMTAVTHAIQSLSQKINTGTGGGITEENLMKGIAASAAALIIALRELALCMDCDNLIF